MTPSDRSPARRGLNLLLAAYPDFELLSVEWQIEPADGRSAARWRGPWILVDLGQPSDHIDVEPAFAVWQFAIWRVTGAVFGIQHDGSVTDEPILDLD